MCENCERKSVEERVAEVRAEILALLDGTHRMCADSAQDEIMAMVALRCSVIASLTPDGALEGAPPSIVLGSWAGVAMESEIRIVESRTMDALAAEISRIAQSN